MSPNVRDISRDRVCPGCRLPVLPGYDEAIRVGTLEWHRECRAASNAKTKTAANW
jgi:hypothetical protein